MCLKPNANCACFDQTCAQSDQSIHNSPIEYLNGRIDDLLFYVLFNSFSVISGRWVGGNERLCTMEPIKRDSNPGPLYSRPTLNPLNYWGSSYRIFNHIDFKELISMFWPGRRFVWDCGTNTSSESGFRMTRLRNCLIHFGNAVPAIYVIILLFYCQQGYRNFLIFSLPKMSLQRP